MQQTHRRVKALPVIQRPLALRLIAAAMRVPVPRGFVRIMTCPACIPPLLIKLPSLAMPVTLNPAALLVHKIAKQKYMFDSMCLHSRQEENQLRQSNQAQRTVWLTARSLQLRAHSLYLTAHNWKLMTCAHRRLLAWFHTLTTNVLKGSTTPTSPGVP